MKKFLILMLALVFVLACSVTGQPAAPTGPSVATIVAMTMGAVVTVPPPAVETPIAPPPTQPPAQTTGVNVSYKNVSFFLPQTLGTNALSGTEPAVTGSPDGPTMNVAPESIKFQLDHYPLFGTFHDAYILVYPAQEYAAVNPGASDSITHLQAILNGSAPLTAENLPHVAAFNAGQVFAAKIQQIQFQNGRGVRFLTEYAQYYATANNEDMFYEFQGLTNDGNYYILAILPASHPLLAINSDPASTVPAGGIPFPGYDDQPGLNAYYPAVVNLLNSQPPDSFTPTLSDLDTLIQSITVVP